MVENHVLSSKTDWLKNIYSIGVIFFLYSFCPISLILNSIIEMISSTIVKMKRDDWLTEYDS
jgi:hypothetical protein